MIPVVGRREEKKAQTRQRLLDAAATVFARRGIVAASLDEIAEEAGLTKGAVYSNFDGKDDLVDSLLHERLDTRLGRIAELVDPEGSVEQHAEQAEELFMRIFEEEREMYLLGLEFAVHRARNPDVAARHKGDRELQDSMAEFMQRYADERGLPLPMPAHELATGLFALASGINLMRLTDPDRVPDGLFPKLLTVIFGGSAPT